MMIYDAICPFAGEMLYAHPYADTMLYAYAAHMLIRCYISPLYSNTMLYTAPMQIFRCWPTAWMLAQHDATNLKRHNQSKIIKKSVILFWLLNMSI